MIKDILEKLFNYYAYQGKIAKTMKEDEDKARKVWTNLMYEKVKNWKEMDLVWVANKIKDHKSYLPARNDFADFERELNKIKSQERKQKPKGEKEIDLSPTPERQTYNVGLFLSLAEIMLRMKTDNSGLGSLTIKTEQQKRKDVKEFVKYLEEAEKVNKMIKATHERISKTRDAKLLYPLEECLINPDKIIEVLPEHIKEIVKDMYYINSLPDELPQEEAEELPF